MRGVSLRCDVLTDGAWLLCVHEDGNGRRCELSAFTVRATCSCRGYAGAIYDGASLSFTPPIVSPYRRRYAKLAQNTDEAVLLCCAMLCPAIRCGIIIILLSTTLEISGLFCVYSGPVGRSPRTVYYTVLHCTRSYHLPSSRYIRWSTEQYKNSFGRAICTIWYCTQCGRL